jgi:hypothetical protein
MTASHRGCHARHRAVAHHLEGRHSAWQWVQATDETCKARAEAWFRQGGSSR